MFCKKKQKTAKCIKMSRASDDSKGLTMEGGGPPGNMVYLKERGSKSVRRGTPGNAIAIYRGGPHTQAQKP